MVSRLLVIGGDLLTGGSLEDELVEGEDFASSFQDSGSCGLGDSQGSNGELGDVQKSHIISDSSYDDDSSLSIIMSIKYSIILSW